MIKKFGLKNFKAFGNQINLDLAPITILTGPNNSGKSTIIRALKLLSESAENEGLWSILRRSSETDYQSFLNLKNRNTKSDSIQFSFDVDGLPGIGTEEQNDFNVQLTYTPDANFKSIGSLTAFKIYDLTTNNEFLSDASEDSLFEQYEWDEHTGDEDNKDRSYSKKQDAIKQVSQILKKNILYLPTYRSKPQREYSRSTDNYLANKLFSIHDGHLKIVRETSSRITAWNFKSMGMQLVFTNEMIKLFGFGKYLTFTPNNNNGNFELLLVGTNNEKTNICDLGYGIYNLISLFLLIDIAAADIQIDYIDNKRGIFGGKYISKYSDKIVLIEEPEISLHPNYQSLLADVFFQAHHKYGLKFIVETHSEYIIRKMQYLIAKGDSDISLDDLLIYYFGNKESEDRIKKIKILEDGFLSEEFGSGFVDEATKTIFDLWTLPKRN